MSPTFLATIHSELFLAPPELRVHHCPALLASHPCVHTEVLLRGSSPRQGRLWPPRLVCPGISALVGPPCPVLPVTMSPDILWDQTLIIQSPKLLGIVTMTLLPWGCVFPAPQADCPEQEGDVLTLIICRDRAVSSCSQHDDCITTVPSQS